jgi:membrane-associated phospholipid phosphatase
VAVQFIRRGRGLLLPPLLTLPPALLGQPPSSPSSFLHDFAHDQGKIWISPARAEKALPWLIPLAVGTAGLIATDHRTVPWVPDQGVHTASIFGDASIGYIAGAPVLLAGLGIAIHDKGATGTGLLAALALADSETMATGLKYAFMRERPPDGGRWFCPRWDPSFPSQHAAGVWAVSAVVARGYPRYRVPAYAVAVVVTASRFFARKHHLSDLLVGSAIGYETGAMVYREYK